MGRFIERLPIVFLAALAATGAAHADGARYRTGQMRAGGWEQSQPAARPNTAATVQQGSGNAAGILQTGTGNDATLMQYGRGNTGTILQAGSNNTACLIQSGRNLNGAIVQAGDYQSSSVLQTRWGANEIPIEVCTSATSPQDFMAYAVRPSGHAPNTRGRRRAAEP